MIITIIGIIIGTLILGTGIYDLAKEKADREARKITQSQSLPAHLYSPE